MNIYNNFQTKNAPFQRMDAFDGKNVSIMKGIRY